MCGRRDEVSLMSSCPMTGGISILSLDNHGLDILGKLHLASRTRAVMYHHETDWLA